MSENKLNDIIGTSLEKIRELADGETVIGNPITTPNGTVIIPVSKVSVGFASGGVDYLSSKKQTPKGDISGQNFGGGGGTGLTVSPVAFLIISPEGGVQLMPISAPSTQPSTVDKVTSLIERSPDLLAKLKAVLFPPKKEKKEKAEEAEAAEEATEEPTAEEVLTEETAE